MGKVITRGALAFALSLAACHADHDNQITVDAAAPDPAPSTVTPSSPFERAALAHGLVPVATDDRGVPRLLRAAQAIPSRSSTPEAAAREQLAALAPAYGLAGAPNDLVIDGVHRLPGGASIVLARQAVGGLDIYGGDVRVLLDRQLGLRAIGGVLRDAAAPRASAFRLSAADAVTETIVDRWGVQVDAADVTVARARARDWRDIRVAPQPELRVDTATARRVLYPTATAMVPAWQTEVYAAPKSGEKHLWKVLVAADTGAVLERADLTQSDAYAYRVFADSDVEARPLEGPQADFDPHPTGVPDGSQPGFAPPTLITMDSFNASHDPWLPSNATETVGNNVDAYLDFNDAADGYTAGTDFRASATGANAFDRIYDTSATPYSSQAQQMAAITNLFYIDNWLHDWWYDSGFDEGAGNAQADNLGRGGVAADPMRAEAQDNSGGATPSTNNANMSTPADGTSPRQQMFLWTTPTDRTLNVGGTAFNSGTAAFGLQTFDTTGTVIVANDGVGALSDACQPLVGVYTGLVVVVDRGTCTFKTKVKNAQDAGAIAVIVANNQGGTTLINMGDDATITTPITIGTLSVSQNDGATIKAMVAPTAIMHRVLAGRDGDLDGTIVAHEWGHYLHHRLTTCDSTQQCGAMSEGWGDFNALMMTLRAGDNLGAVYPLAIYATVGIGDAYFGIRRAPYSIDPTKNGLSFKNIQTSQPNPTGFPYLPLGSNAEVHNAGEIWAGMLFQSYVRLLQGGGHTFDDAHRRMSDYVVGGLQLAPQQATFTETRDAILAVANAVDPADATLLATGFAERGAGSCAVSPAAASTTLNGVVEDFAVAGHVDIGSITLTDDRVSCDDDGSLDAGETGTLSVQVMNGGPSALGSTNVSVSTTAAGVTILAPAAALQNLAPFTTQTLTFEVRMDPDVTGQQQIAIDVNADDTNACNGTASASATFHGNYDNASNVSANDDVESDLTAWTPAGTGAATVWARTASGTNHLWHATESGNNTDTQLVTPVLDVGTGNFSVSFGQAFSLEISAGTTGFDGAVIEVTTDGGTTWNDITTYMASPYNGTVAVTDTVISGRAAFVRSSTGFPALQPLTLDFGTTLAGATVQLRLRLVTDTGGAVYGWDADNFVFSGITNTPFTAAVDNAPTCQAAPIANAGVDQNTTANSDVHLDGTGSTDPNGDPITYAWTQIGGVPVTLSDPADPQPELVAPDGAVDLVLTFRLTVSDPWASSSDDVVVFVDVDNTPPIDAAPLPPDASVPPDAAPVPDASPPAPDARAPADAEAPADAGVPIEGGGGCGCRTEGMPSAGALLPLLLVGFALRRRRR